VDLHPWIFRAVRHQSRNRLVGAGIVLSLALAIGCVGALLSIVRATFFQPLPIHEPERLLSLCTRVGGDARVFPMSFPNYEDLRDRSRSFAGITAFQAIEVSIGIQHPEVLWGQLVTSNFFSVLGVPMALGRGFLPAEEREVGAHRVAVLNYRLWQRKFGGDRSVLGSSIYIDGHPYEVVGIAANAFTGTGKLIEFQIWIPFGMHPEVFYWTSNVRKRDWQIFRAVGRLKPGIVIPEAAQEVRTLFAGLVKEHPSENANQQADVTSLADSSLGLNQKERYLRVTFLLSAVTGLFLLLTCTNVANLLLQQALAQRQDLAVRLALGSRWGGIAGFLLFESALLSVVGGICGIGVAQGVRSLLWHLRPPEMQMAVTYPAIDARLMLVMLGIAVLCGLVMGLAPAWQLKRQDLFQFLKLDRSHVASARSSPALRKILVGAQVGLACLTLVCTTLMIGKLISLYNTRPGFREDTLFVTLNPKLVGHDARSSQRVLEEVRLDLAHRASVQSVGLTESRPMKDLRNVRGMLFKDDLAGPHNRGSIVSVASISPGYLETLGVPLLQGRGIRPQDVERSPRVALINRTLADLRWRGRSPVGERFRFAEEPTTSVTIVGVVEEFKQGTLDEPPAGFVFLPMTQYPVVRASIAIRGSVRPQLLFAELQRAVDAVDPKVPLLQPMTSSELLRKARAPHLLGTALLGVFGLAALGLSGLGVFSLVNHFVEQRRAEIGVRMALGARTPQVLGLLIQQIIGASATGLVVGVVSSRIWLQRLGWLRFEQASFWFAVLVSACFMLVLCVGATLVPACRAVFRSPASSLREEAGGEGKFLPFRLATGIKAPGARKGGEFYEEARHP
jgi:predicted permease